MRALVTGATGFIGRQLVQHLDHPVVLTRDPIAAAGELGQVQAIAWNPLTEAPPASAFDGIDVIFHLAGEPIAEGRWTAAKRQRIQQSREIGTRNLVLGIRRSSPRPKVLVSTSAVGFYGSRGDAILTEQSQPADDFLAAVCLLWEREAQCAADFGLRVVTPRLGVVLGPHGGAVGKMLPLFKLGLGGRLGSGRQWMPWVHVDDVVKLMLHAAQHESLVGPVNATAPNPVTNREFTQTLAGVVHRPAFFPAPELGLRIILGGFADVLLASQRVMPAAALANGYTFQYPHLEPALQAVIHPPHAAASAHDHGHSH